ncbi:hypothetical protein ACFVVM_12450 [Nocardia sp. NPDC058176]|uniref:hypothetical protein n=1 Tax=Nocardia sp. NPDC058176 TaxID=3346368 RepID=UPI0036DB5850
MVTNNIPARASGQLRSYARNAEIWATLETVPGFTNAVAIADEATAMLEALEQKQAELADGFTVETILEVGQIPPSWLDSIAARAVDREAVRLQLAAVTSLRGAAHGAVQNIVTESGDEILSVLGERMAAVVGKLREAVTELGAANTPAEAIELGTADAWKKIIDLVPEYQRLRLAQATVHNSVGGRWAESWQRAKKGKAGGRDIPFSSYAIVKNLDEVFPKFGYVHPDDFSPWSHDVTYFLVEILKRGGDLWLPTERELSAMLVERREFFDAEHKAARDLYKRNIREYRERSDAGEFHPEVSLRLSYEIRAGI